MTRATAIFDRTVEQTHQWLLELMDELGWLDEHKAQRALKAGLHALRDRLTVNEAAQLGSQLPALVRGYYYEGWRPSGKPRKERHREEFLAHLERCFRPEEGVNAEHVARAVFNVLANRVSQGEIEDVLHILPGELRELWS
jgi:uncharacterized protein (DUF2267 family)